MKGKCFILVISIITINLFFCKSISCQEIIHEGFDSGTVAPQGWIIKAGGVYSSASNSGTAIPSIKLSATGHFIETCQFSNATECSFMIKGNSTDSLSALVVYYEVDSIWFKLDSLTQLTKTKIIIVLPLPEDAQKLKFLYYKSMGNIAFDDLIVRNALQNSDTLPPVFQDKSPKVIDASDTSVSFAISINKPGVVHYIITSESCPVPQKDAFFNPALYDTACLINYGLYNIFHNTDTFVSINGLKAGTKYFSYWLSSSANGSVISDSSSATCEFSLPKDNFNLFFSEIIKGSGNNKAIEIFNPTSDTVLLANFRIVSSTNGGGWKTTYYKFPKGATIAPQDVYVILKANADTSIVSYSVADDSTNSSVLGFYRK